MFLRVTTRPSSLAITGVCSWESRRSPKPFDRVRILALLLTDGGEHRGLTPPARQVLIRADVARDRKAAVP